jgi:hypothetical protein
MPEKTAPASTAPPSMPYRIGTVHQPGYVPFTSTSTHPTAVQEPVYPVSNWASWVSLFLGVGALALTLANLLPGSSTLWISGAGVLAVLCGLLAILRRMRKRATNTWAPIVGVLFGLGATAITLLGIGVGDIITTATSGLLPTSSTSASDTVAPVRPVSPEPFVFSANPALTEDGTEVQQIATALNDNYASGNSTLGEGQAWPQSLKFTLTQMLAVSGTPLVTVAPGHRFTYTVSPDLKSYTFAVSSGDLTESAVYNSATDRFTFACPASDTTCVPVH